MNAYSVNYEEHANFHDDSTCFSVDWNWKVRVKWARSVKEGNSWQVIIGLSRKSYEALLEHFGLEEYADEFPIEKIISISPARLVAARRAKEETHGFDKKTVVSDTLGDHRPAEEFRQEEV